MFRPGHWEVTYACWPRALGLPKPRTCPQRVRKSRDAEAEHERGRDGVHVVRVGGDTQHSVDDCAKHLLVCLGLVIAVAEHGDADPEVREQPERDRYAGNVARVVHDLHQHRQHRVSYDGLRLHIHAVRDTCAETTPAHT
jgi:hypothetical protein